MRRHISIPHIPLAQLTVLCFITADVIVWMEGLKGELILTELAEYGLVGADSLVFLYLLWFILIRTVFAFNLYHKY